MKECALFDFDGTLTTRDTTALLCWELGKFRPWRLVIRLPLILKFFLTGKSSLVIQQTKNQFIGSLISGLTFYEVEKPLARFRSRVNKIERLDVMERLHQFLADGKKVVVVTASPEFAICYYFAHIDVEVIGTKFETKNGRFTGHVQGKNCYGKEKLLRINEWLQGVSEDYSVVEAWGDSKADIPMMSVAEKRCCVNA